ncbi:FSH1-domain-containing protein [Trichodelitschia bisporula]|uniref:FSH1-domain-containing protein n=1 Tax=Trichodelitschia bisporula TaxID=703511 RepID=A0A6G1HMW1_9PEZI|nr:FSH1-domain-containing protein [Trichodelitschia bisporula]
MPPTTPAPALRILMLHGYTQSGPLFTSKTRALAKLLQTAFPSSTLSFPTAPHRLSTTDLPSYDPTIPISTSLIPAEESGALAGTAPDGTDEPAAYAWFRRPTRDSTEIVGLDGGFEALAEVLRKEGPFDGVVGFSQGGAMAALLASVLEPGRWAHFGPSTAAFPVSFRPTEAGPIHPPFKFAVIYSGFRLAGAEHDAFYAGGLATPTCHFIGSVDTVVEEKRSLALAELCEKPRVVYHPGGHFLPSGKQYVGALVGWLREVLAPPEKKEEDASEMDMPF